MGPCNMAYYNVATQCVQEPMHCLIHSAKCVQGVAVKKTDAATPGVEVGEVEGAAAVEVHYPPSPSRPPSLLHCATDPHSAPVDSLPHVIPRTLPLTLPPPDPLLPHLTS